mmetsp:Transcript_19109/g.48671  ORF Transcript_19109/g.48671 Transcript_19109/m.48671 type:complete len:218 (-) Transcript_19109:286-939(-)
MRSDQHASWIFRCQTERGVDFKTRSKYTVANPESTVSSSTADTPRTSEPCPRSNGSAAAATGLEGGAERSASAANTFARFMTPCSSWVINTTPASRRSSARHLLHDSRRASISRESTAVVTILHCCKTANMPAGIFLSARNPRMFIAKNRLAGTSILPACPPRKPMAPCSAAPAANEDSRLTMTPATMSLSISCAASTDESDARVRWMPSESRRSSE